MIRGFTMKAAIRGTEIYFDVAGMQLAPQGDEFVERPVLFMLHGGPGGDHLRFKQHSLELQEVAQLVFIDHRGCGRSKKTKQAEYTLENNIEDIEALRKYLGLKRICILGTSYGGMVAQGYAVRYPQRLEKLILVVTAPSYRFLEEAKNNLMTHGTPQQVAIGKSFWKGHFKNSQEVLQFFEVMDPLYSVSQNKPYNRFRDHQTAWSYQALNQGLRTYLRTFDFTAQLKKIKCPTLVLAGENDWVCPAAHSKVIVQQIPQAILKIFKHCGHSMAVDAHEKYIKTIKKFLKT